MPHSSAEPIATVIIPYTPANGFYDEVEIGTMIIIAVSSEEDYSVQTYGASFEGQFLWNVIFAQAEQFE